MSFWPAITVAYVMLLGLGVAIGRYLAARGSRGDGRGRRAEPVPPTPPGPTFGVEWPPLGSDFDRAFLPAAFADSDVAEHA